MTDAKNRLESAVGAICELAAEVTVGSRVSVELELQTSWYWCRVLQRAAVIHFAGALYDSVVEENPPVKS